jgi:hypothetical protein
MTEANSAPDHCAPSRRGRRARPRIRHQGTSVAAVGCCGQSQLSGRVSHGAGHRRHGPRNARYGHPGRPDRERAAYLDREKALQAAAIARTRSRETSGRRPVRASATTVTRHAFAAQTRSGRGPSRASGRLRGPRRGRSTPRPGRSGRPNSCSRHPGPCTTCRVALTERRRVLKVRLRARRGASCTSLHHHPLSHAPLTTNVARPDPRDRPGRGARRGCPPGERRSRRSGPRTRQPTRNPDRVHHRATAKAVRPQAGDPLAAPRSAPPRRCPEARRRCGRDCCFATRSPAVRREPAAPPRPFGTAPAGCGWAYQRPTADQKFEHQPCLAPMSSMSGRARVKADVTGLGWLGAGPLTAVGARSEAFQSSIRSRWADQSVVRGSGAQSSGRPSGWWRTDIGASSPEHAQAGEGGVPGRGAPKWPTTLS